MDWHACHHGNHHSSKPLPNNSKTNLNLKYTISKRKSCLFGSLCSPLSRTFPLEFEEKWNTLLPSVNVPDPNDSPVDGAGDAVETLLVCLWKFILLVDRCIEDIFGGRSIDHVLDHETLDSLIFWNKPSTIQAVHCLFTTCIHLSTAAVSALLRHLSPKGRPQPPKPFGRRTVLNCLLSSF